MGFREHLEDVCKAEGAVAAAVMGFDGIEVERVTPVELELDLAALLVEFTGILSQIRNAAEVMQVGGVEEASIVTEKLTCVLRPVNAEYFAVLALKPGGNFGKGRFLLRIAASKLKSEF